MSEEQTYDHSYSDAGALESYWRGLAKQATFTIRVSAEDLSAAHDQLMTLGACGILIRSFEGYDYLIEAQKGKRGPCYDTGRTATLHEDLCAALDDDGHLLLGRIPVCEKTAGIYQHEHYQRWVSISEPDPALMERFEKDPEDFNCDDLDSQAAALSQSLTASKEEKDKTFCYAGPFKLLICHDGSMLWRNRPLRITASCHASLMKAGVASLDCEDAAEAAADYAQLYKEQGTVCLLDAFLTNERDDKAEISAIDWSALDSCSTEFQIRLRTMIETDQDYMIVVGSDPGDPLGCCPSEDVAQANVLLRAGILDRRQQSGSGDTCPISLYACAGEIAADSDSLRIEKNKQLRKDLLERLAVGAASSSELMRWILMVFIFFTLILGFIQLLNDVQVRPTLSHNEALLSAVAPVATGEEVILCLFREENRCDLCLSLERGARQTLNEFFNASDNISFRNVNTDLPSLKSLREELDLFTSTLVLFKCRDGEILKSRVIEEAWYMHDDPPHFHDMLKQEIQRFRMSE